MQCIVIEGLVIKYDDDERWRKSGKKIMTWLAPIFFINNAMNKQWRRCSHHRRHHRSISDLSETRKIHINKNEDLTDFSSIQMWIFFLFLFLNLWFRYDLQSNHLKLSYEMRKMCGQSINVSKLLVLICVVFAVGCAKLMPIVIERT